MLARRPRGQAAQADRDGEGRPHRRRAARWRRPHRPPHRLRRDHSRGVPPVRRHPGRRPRRAARGLGGVRPHAARRRRRRATRRLRLRDLRRHRRAHGRHARRRRPAPPAARQGDAARAARRAHPRVPAGVATRSTAAARRSPTRAAARSSTRSSPTRTSTSLVVPITGAVGTFSEPFARDLVDVAEDHRQADLRGVGLAARHRRHLLPAPARRRAARCSARSATACGRCAPTSTTGRFAARYRSPFADAPLDAAARGAARRARILDDGRARRRALRARVEAAARARTASRSSNDVLVRDARRPR